MEIRRTANAGVLLKMDGVSLLLDGVCREYPPFLGTPDALREQLLAMPPDVLAFTHRHPDHYDEEFAEAYHKKTLRPIYGAESIGTFAQGSLRLKILPSRHLGKADLPHASFILEGSRCVWFMGDASPLGWKNAALPKPDILIAPYAYANTSAAWKQAKALGAEKIVLLHLPLRAADPLGLWAAVEEVTKGEQNLLIPALNEKIIL